MYTTCLRCERSLGRNAEIPHLSVGRRMAFDTATGRLWVICTRCGQWNLTAIEERWEALAECERLAVNAEAHVAGRMLGLAQTASGLELLRVGGMPEDDVANWRYGHRVLARRRRVAWVLPALGVLAVILAVGAGHVAESAFVAVYLTVLLACLAYRLWRHPPRLWMRLSDETGRRYLLWPWQVDDVQIVPATDAGGLELFLPHARGQSWLRGVPAAAILAGLLPKLNRADCTYADVGDALRQVADAEVTHQSTARERTVSESAPEWAEARGPARPRNLSRLTLRSPWERVVGGWAGMPALFVGALSPERRLALEMATTEEVERSALRARATAAEPQWRAEEEIGEIADDLLVPPAVAERLTSMKDRRDAGD